MALLLLIDHPEILTRDGSSSLGLIHTSGGITVIPPSRLIAIQSIIIVAPTSLLEVVVDPPYSRPADLPLLFIKSIDLAIPLDRKSQTVSASLGQIIQT